MRFKIVCSECEQSITIRGHNEDDVNAVVLDENDPNWNEACACIKAGGEYEIFNGEYDDDY